MNYLDVYKKRVTHLGVSPQERAFNSGILEFKRYLKYNQHVVHNLINESNAAIFSGAILTDKEDENRVSQILLVELDVAITTGDLILWNEEHWLVYRKTTSSYQPYQKFYMVRCNHYIKWVDADGNKKESWIYLLGSKDAKIKDNFRTWNEMITPQPNKHIQIILPHVLMPINTEIMVLDEVWYLVDFDQNSVPGVIFMSFTETNLNLQRDDLEDQLANSDSLAKWTIETAKEQTVAPKTKILVDCYVYKNGMKYQADPNEFTYTTRGNIYLNNGEIYSTQTGMGEITITYKGASCKQIIMITEEISPTCVIVGNDKMRVAQKAEYVLEGADVVDFIIEETSLAKIESVNGNKCIVRANDNNRLKPFTLKAYANGVEYSKTIQIVSLWQVI